MLTDYLRISFLSVTNIRVEGFYLSWPFFDFLSLNEKTSFLSHFYDKLENSVYL